VLFPGAEVAARSQRARHGNDRLGACDLPSVMHELPTVKRGGLCCRLPLSALTANALFDALLASDSQERAEIVERAVAGDPAFVLWLLAGVAADRAEPLRTAAALADAFSPDLAGWLIWPKGDLGSPVDSTSAWADPARFADLASRAVQVARAVRAAANADAAQGDPAQNAAADEAAFLGLVYEATQWLALACQADGEHAAGALLPEWLSTDLAALAHGAAATPAAQHVAAAIRRLAAEGTASRSAAAEAMSRNDAALDYFARRLKRLVAKLRRLETLESDFAGQLEREKIEAAKELAYGAGHEINNPLANISARAQTMLSDTTDPETRRKLAAIHAQARRAHEMIADLMLFARPPAIEREDFDLRLLIAACGEELRERALAQHTQLVLDLPHDPVPVRADRAQLAVAVRALVTNALEAVALGGQVQVSLAAGASNARPSHEQAVEITVIDTGPGIPDEVRPRLFDPYFSGREAGRGLGMGLCKCWTIVTGHGGTIDVESGPSGGARFKIAIPAPATPPA